MKKTAVEWLIEELLENFNIEYEIIEQAKEMEKEQIMDAFYTEQIDEFGDEVTFEDYYNETFKSE